MAKAVLRRQTGRWSSVPIVTCVMFMSMAFVSLTSAQQVRRAGTPIQAWHAGVTAAGTVGLFFIDEPVRDFLQANRSDGADAVAHVFRQLGEVGVVYPASAGVLGLGFLVESEELKRSGAQLAASLTLAAGITLAGKFLFGRARPFAERGAWSFAPFEGVYEKALPSGHTALAFAFATTFADFTDDDVARAFFFAAAAGTGWSRINDDRHWLSDVALGAMLGIASSKLVTGRWTLFGIETPRFLAEPGVEPVNFGELAVGAFAGIAIAQAVRLVVTSSQRSTPLFLPLDGGNLGAGVRFTF